jgi:hypothetical protein
MRGRAASVIVVAVAAPLPWTVPVHASTLSEQGLSLIYSAAPSETNALKVRLDGAAILFRDSGAAITGVSASGCTQRDSHTVACDAAPPPLMRTVDAQLGDGNDQATVDLPS